MATKVWYEIWGYGQYKEDGAILLAKVKCKSNALQVKQTFLEIGYKDVFITMCFRASPLTASNFQRPRRMPP